MLLSFFHFFLFFIFVFFLAVCEKIFFLFSFQIKKKKTLVARDAGYDDFFCAKKNKLRINSPVSLGSVPGMSFTLIVVGVCSKDCDLLLQALYQLKLLYKFNIKLIFSLEDFTEKTLVSFRRRCASCHLTHLIFSETTQNKNQLGVDIIFVNKIFLLEKYDFEDNFFYLGSNFSLSIKNFFNFFMHAKAVSLSPYLSLSHEISKLLELNLAEIAYSSSEIVNWCSYYYDAKFIHREALTACINDQRGATRRV